MLVIFSLTKIHEIFLLIVLKETWGCFQALAIVILVPRKINIIRRCISLEVPAIGKLRSANWGSCGMGMPVIFRITLKMFHTPLILGQSHHICNVDPLCPQFRKHRGEEDGYILANLSGTRYHLIMTFRFTSVNAIFNIPWEAEKGFLCQSTKLQDCPRSFSHSSMNVFFESTLTSAW